MSTFLVSCAAITLSAWADEEAGAPASPVDPTGTWAWDVTFNDNPSEFSLELNWNGKELTGDYTAFDNTTKIEETKLEGDELSFLSRREFNGNKFIVRFQGKVEPDEIVGTVTVDFREGPQEFDWNAKRVVTTDDVLGTWKLHLETPNGVIEPQITITKEGDKLHGAYVSPFGERDAKNVSLKEGELSWEISSDDNDDFDFTVVYRGKPRGNSISGTNEFDFGGNTGTMEFRGQRTPPKAEAAAEEEPAAETPAAQ
jgi:hypothetical protein